MPERVRNIFDASEKATRQNIRRFGDDDDENKYSDIPGWEGGFIRGTSEAILLSFTHHKTEWFPYSQLRRARDDQSIYATDWILERKLD